MADALSPLSTLAEDKPAPEWLHISVIPGRTDGITWRDEKVSRWGCGSEKPIRPGIPRCTCKKAAYSPRVAGGYWDAHVPSLKSPFSSKSREKPPGPPLSFAGPWEKGKYNRKGNLQKPPEEASPSPCLSSSAAPCPPPYLMSLTLCHVLFPFQHGWAKLTGGFLWFAGY